jgi:hypothetical protein
MSWPTFVNPANFQEELRKTTKNLSQDGQCPRQI